MKVTTEQCHILFTKRRVFRYNLDLDEKIRTEGFDKVLREDLLKGAGSFEQQPAQEKLRVPFFSSYGQSCSVRRIQRPDGVTHFYIFFLRLCFILF
jgi:hypothetical protein